MAVRRASVEDVPRVAQALADAFAGDPPMSWFVPDTRRRRAMLVRYFESVVPRLYMPAGETWMSPDPVGAAVWVAPGRAGYGARSQLRVLPALLRLFGRWPRRALLGLPAIVRGEPSDPHWYLEYIGVEASGRGRGTGSALLGPVLERCDAERVPAYLNAGSPDSRRLYLRHGFEATEEFRLPFGGPPLWRMWREPR